MQPEKDTKLRTDIENLIDDTITTSFKEQEASRNKEMERMEREKDKKIIEFENKMVNMVAKLNLGETGALIEEFNGKLENLQIANLTITEQLKK